MGDHPVPVVDPEFPVGGTNFRCTYVSKKLSLKTKDSGPLGPGAPHGYTYECAVQCLLKFPKLECPWLEM